MVQFGREHRRDGKPRGQEPAGRPSPAPRRWVGPDWRGTARREALQGGRLGEESRQPSILTDGSLQIQQEGLGTGRN